MIKIKTEKQLKYIRQACKFVAQILAEIETELKPGITTAEIDRKIEARIIELGAKPAFKGYRGYKNASCLSINEQVVHGIPGSRKLVEGDVIGVDVGTIVNGFYGDAAITFPVGRVSKKEDKQLKAGSEALTRAIKQARAGNHLGDISSTIEKFAKSKGFSVVKDFFGHGLGAQLHEDPLIPNFGSPGTGPQLKPGMVLAIEPMLNQGTSEVETLSDGWTVVTKDRKVSVHFEHAILITDGEPEILTMVN